MSTTRIQWTVALTLAFLVHAVLAAAFRQSLQDYDMIPIEEGVEISIALAEPEAEAKPEAAPEPKPAEAKPEPEPQPEKQPEPEPAPLEPPPQPEPAVEPEPLVESEPVKEPEPVPVEPVKPVETPQPPVIVMQEPAVSAPPTPAAFVLEFSPQAADEPPPRENRRAVPALTASTSPPAHDTAASEPVSAAADSNERFLAGGSPDARQSYLNKLAERLARYKRYPREARHEGVTGVVMVKFTILANGTIQTQQIVRSSGDSRLDEAALELLTRASPFTPIPSSLEISTMTLTLPVEYTLHKRK